MGDHARLSASASSRWLSCHASLAMEEREHNANPIQTSSKYADEGTAAHELAELVLRLDNPQPDDVYKFQGQCADNGYEFTQDMCDFIKTYVTHVLEYSEGNYLFVEQRVDYSHVLKDDEWEKDIAVDKNTAFGTADGIIVTTDGTELQVHDLKYGMGVQVYAKENTQLMCYALGALHEYNTLGLIQTVKMVIHQPRLYHLDEWSCDISRLDEFADQLSNAAEPTLAYADGLLDDTEVPPFNPSESACRWCDAKASCPAIAGFVMEKVTGVEFDDVTESDIQSAADDMPRLDERQLAEAMTYLDMINDWTKAIRARTESILLSGGSIEGYKVVKGKRGARKFIDPQAAEEFMKKSRLKIDEMYNKQLKSPTQLEKAIAKDRPRKWKDLQEFIVQPDGKLAVVPVGDKRPAVNVEPVEFDNLDDNDNDV